MRAPKGDTAVGDGIAEPALLALDNVAQQGLLFLGRADRAATQQRRGDQARSDNRGDSSNWSLFANKRNDLPP